RMAIPNYLRLQQDLNDDPHNQSRGLERTQAEQPAVTVKPLGDRYALVELSPDTPLDEQWLQRLRQSYVQSTLPVLSRVQANGAGENSDHESGAIAAADSASIVVTPELVVSVEPSLTEGATRQLLSQYNMDIVRPLQFSEGRYLVRSRNLEGTAILAAANHLGTVPGIQSATPNFVQSIPYTVTSPSIASPAAPTSPAPSNVPEISDAPSLLPLQWHLNSRRIRPRPYYPTGVQATEAWNQSRGNDVVVAVIDSLIQWDHPDLADQVYAVPADTEGRLPGEVHGWDFSHTETVCDSQNSCAVGDGDTRISDDEMAQLRPHLQNTFTLSDDELLDQYGRLARWIRFERPDFSLSQQADWVRRLIQSNISSEFHGTWSAGVVAANPGDRPGAFGVAPDAKFLPVRVFGLGGHITAASLIEAVGYAAARDVDVINLSLGGLLPDQELSGQMFEVMDANPDLVIVAAAGNSQLDGVSFPAALPGVISVGATSLSGNRTFYSSYGAGLDVVAPGGETHH
ncbi:MAG: S8 family serine peptidase, partial [Cyanobacteria bacterium P01_H01_bin.130]